jgi:endonuclease/exonuclease/phosphatase family metal-dependent hydrolase
MGNKGAISLEFNLLGQSFQMLNCHLAPHQTGSEIRNQTVNRILDELLKVDLRYEIIFLGDFNYRIEMTKDEYRSLSGNSRENTDESAKYSSLFHKEQLSNQQDLKRNFLLKF